jgi:choline dehydrogenase
MWDWLRRYPSVQLGEVGTPYENQSHDDVVSIYDYIIVGGNKPLQVELTSGGTAGCILANRLSANPNVNVLLLERGQVVDSFIARCALLSAGHSFLMPTKEIKFAEQVELPDREITSLEAFALGGRTSINGTLYMPGCPEEYECWGEGWKWNDVAPFFSRLEGFSEFENRRNPGQEGGEYKTRLFTTGEFESAQQ